MLNTRSFIIRVITYWTFFINDFVADYDNTKGRLEI